MYVMLVSQRLASGSSGHKVSVFWENRHGIEGDSPFTGSVTCQSDRVKVMEAQLFLAKALQETDGKDTQVVIENDFGYFPERALTLEILILQLGIAIHKAKRENSQK